MIYFLIKQATLYNYAGDNTLAYFSKTMPDLVDTLEKETGVALSWLKQNEMIPNHEQFHAILLRKNQTSTSGEKINVDGEIINSEKTVKLLGITLDYGLEFDPHISNICIRAATQLNVLQRLKSLIGFKEKFLFKALSFQSLSTVLWCGIFHPLNLFRTLKSYMSVLRFLYNDHTSSYNDLLSKSERCTVLISRQRAFCIELFKTVNKLNTPFMQKIFKLRTSCACLCKIYSKYSTWLLF